jgi:hypothetical protein
MKNTHLHGPCSMNHPPSTGPIRCGDRCEFGPGTDRATAPLLREIGADQRQAWRDQQRPAYSLKASGENQVSNVGASRTRLTQRE